MPPVEWLPETEPLALQRTIWPVASLMPAMPPTLPAAPDDAWKAQRQGARLTPAMPPAATQDPAG